jgi:hypothetical protein
VRKNKAQNQVGSGGGIVRNKQGGRCICGAKDIKEQLVGNTGKKPVRCRKARNEWQGRGKG